MESGFVAGHVAALLTRSGRVRLLVFGLRFLAVERNEEIFKIAF